MTRNIDQKPLRTEQERMVGAEIEKIFNESADAVETRLENFPKYVRRQHLTRFLAHYEIFKRILRVKGSIVECGVNRGYGLMTWAKLSALLEPTNLTRRIYGFDTFAGFPSVSDKDRFLGHIAKVELVKGDAAQTIPAFMADHPHLVVSLLFMDFDLYEPTRAALEHFVPRMPRGAILAFDELDNPLWPGETKALLDTLGIGRLKLQRLEFDPYIAFARIP